MTNQAYSGHGSHQLIADYIINEKTGTIIFQPEGRKLFFEEGRLIFADSDNPAEKFQAIMVQNGIVDAETLERTKTSLKQGESLGKRLKQDGLVDSKQLAVSLKQQITVVVEEVVKQAEGSYRIHNALPAKVPHLKIQTMALIVRSLTRLQNFNFHGGEEDPLIKTDSFESTLAKLDFPESYGRLLEHIRKSPSATAQDLSTSFKIDVKLCNGLLYALEILGLLSLEEQDDDEELLIVEEDEDDLSFDEAEDEETKPAMSTAAVAAAAAGMSAVAASQADDDSEDAFDDDATLTANEGDDDTELTVIDDDDEAELSIIDEDDDDDTLTAESDYHSPDEDATLTVTDDSEGSEPQSDYDETTLPGVNITSAEEVPEEDPLSLDEEDALEIDDSDDLEDPSEQSGDALADILPEGNTDAGESMLEQPPAEEDEAVEPQLSEAERHTQSDGAPFDVNTDNYLSAPEDDEEDDDELLASPGQDPDSSMEVLDNEDGLRTVAIANPKERLDQHLAEMKAEETPEVHQDHGSVESLNTALDEMDDSQEPEDDDFDKLSADLDDEDEFIGEEPEADDPNATLTTPPDASFDVDDSFSIPKREPPQWDDDDLDAPITGDMDEETPGDTYEPQPEPESQQPKGKPIWLLAAIIILALLGALSLLIPLPSESEPERVASTPGPVPIETTPAVDEAPPPVEEEQPEDSVDQAATDSIEETEPVAAAPTETAPEPQPQPEAVTQPSATVAEVAPAEEDDTTTITEDPPPQSARVDRPQPQPVQEPVESADLVALTEDAVSRLQESDGQYSVALLVACQKETVDKILARHGTDQIFVFPRSLSGRQCYMLTWGLYTNRQAALEARDADVPDSLYNADDPGWIVNLNNYRQ